MFVLVTPAGTWRFADPMGLPNEAPIVRHFPDAPLRRTRSLDEVTRPSRAPARDERETE